MWRKASKRKRAKWRSNSNKSRPAKAPSVCIASGCTCALMLRPRPDLPPQGIFCAGEMLDWEAPTGGYLLTACFASGLRAGRGAVRWLQGAR